MNEFMDIQKQLTKWHVKFEISNESHVFNLSINIEAESEPLAIKIAEIELRKTYPTWKDWQYRLKEIKELHILPTSRHDLI